MTLEGSRSGREPDWMAETRTCVKGTEPWLRTVDGPDDLNTAWLPIRLGAEVQNAGSAGGSERKKRMREVEGRADLWAC